MHINETLKRCLLISIESNAYEFPISLRSLVKARLMRPGREAGNFIPVQMVVYLRETICLVVS